MLIGIMSDSHDNLTMIERAADVMKKHRVDVLLHAGDYIAPFSIPYLKLSGAKTIIGVYGNNDGEVKGLKKAFNDINGRLEKAPLRFDLEGLKIMMMHESTYLADAKEDPSLNLVIFGHTHKLFIEKKSGKIILNPGETCGYITGRKTLILLDTETMEPETVDLV
jgi:putative phosphoesterase